MNAIYESVTHVIKKSNVGRLIAMSISAGIATVSMTVGAYAADAPKQPLPKGLTQRPWIVPRPDAKKPMFLMEKLMVSDIMRSRDFYIKTLGMKELTRLEQNGAVNEMVLGWNDNPMTGKLALSWLHDKDLAASIATAAPYTNLVLQVPDVVATLNKIKENGGSIVMDAVKTGPVGEGGFLLAFAKDPDGHVLEFFQFASYSDSLPTFDLKAPPAGLTKLYQK